MRNLEGYCRLEREADFLTCLPGVVTHTRIPGRDAAALYPSVCSPM